VGHVLRHTFNIRMFTSIAAAVIYYLFIMSVFDAVLPRISPGLEQ